MLVLRQDRSDSPLAAGAGLGSHTSSCVLGQGGHWEGLLTQRTLSPLSPLSSTNLILRLRLGALRFLLNWFGVIDLDLAGHFQQAVQIIWEAVTQYLLSTEVLENSR